MYQGWGRFACFGISTHHPCRDKSCCLRYSALSGQSLFQCLPLQYATCRWWISLHPICVLVIRPVFVDSAISAVVASLVTSETLDVANGARFSAVPTQVARFTAVETTSPRIFIDFSALVLRECCYDFVCPFCLLVHHCFYYVCHYILKLVEI